MFDRDISLTDFLRDNRWLYGFISIVTALAGGWLVGTFGIMGALMTVGVPVVIIVIIGILMDPKFGLLLYVNLSFFIGFSRFLSEEIPVGLGLDGLLAFTLLSTFINGKRMNWSQLKQPVFWVINVWLFYTILEYFNPEHPYPAAWFYHARSFSLSWFYLTIIVLVNPITKDEIRWLVRIWLVWSFFAALWGFKQQYIGLEDAENRWLASGGARTHILWGQLRSFSFYSDAGQFGAEMAGVTLVCLIRFFEEKPFSRQLAYLALALILFWGYAVSGTRSALFVLLAGYPAYLVLKRNPIYIIRGALIASPVLAILLFTNIGDSVYQIYRIRTALRPSEDASFLVRLENQQKLRAFLKDKPFGAGIGTSSGAGNRFSPDHFAAQIPPDSWYVQLWIETGIVGLSLYLLMLVCIIGIGFYKVWRLKDPELIKLMIVLLAEFIGITVVSYSNPIMGQYPTSSIVFITSILFTTCERWDSATLGLVTHKVPPPSKLLV